MNISESNEYMTSNTKSYWCHICKKEFVKLYIRNVDINCRICGSGCCEEISSSSEDETHPVHFQIFDNNNNINNSNINNSNYNSNESLNSNSRSNRNNRNLSSLLNAHSRLNRSRNFLEMLLSVINQGSSLSEDSSMDSILNYIMATDPNRYGNPPASKKTVETLEKITIDEEYLKIFKDGKIENSCPVCKDEFCVKETSINLPCKHMFHEDCIKPWLQERNTCPTCRSELPTDDLDFEARKNSN